MSSLSHKERMSGDSYYRSLNHLADSPEVLQYLEREFPGLAQAVDSSSRRQFLRLLGASMALAGITSTGCRRWPTEEVRPHAARAEGAAPGVPQHFATSFDVDGVSTGMLAKSYDGRPIKIEGNPEHPFSLGAADAIAQASVLELYDPDRSRSVIDRTSGNQSLRSWDDFSNFASAHFQSLKASQGDGLAFLVQSVSSPTWRRLRSEFEQAFPKARWFEYSPLHRDNEHAGSRAAFGKVLRTQLDLTKASLILSFDADLLGTHPAHLKYARDWSAGRRSVDHGEMNRMIVVESTMTVTGSVADTRMPLKPSLVNDSVAYVAHELGLISDPPTTLSKEQTHSIDVAVADLRAAGPRAVVIAGPAQSPRSHQLVHAINEALGNLGNCIHYTEEIASDKQIDQIQKLSELLQGNVLNTVVIVDGNPVYDAPVDTPLNLESTDSRPLTSIHLSLHDNETSRQCTWHLPAAHFLECWGDGSAWDGTYTLQQPLILPLYQGKSPIEFLSLLSGQAVKSGLPLVRATFDARHDGATHQDWEVALHAGFRSASSNESIPPGPVKLDSSQTGGELAVSNSRWEVRFVADSKTLDGRFANNAWLQELPEPLTKLTWDNAALVSPQDASDQDWANGDVLRISADPSHHIEIPVYIMPGQARGCITLPLGYGRTHAGHIGNQVGVNVYPLRRGDSSHVAADCEVAATGEHGQLVSTQEHFLLDPVAEQAKRLRLGEQGEPGMLIHEVSLAKFLNDEHSIHGHSHSVHQAPLFDLPEQFDSPHKWGMSIDLNACIGCSGCVVACQAENNIPVVGKANVAVNREMHWIRIDRYFKGDPATPDVVHLPTACVHCENAPCEQVCPVAATVHDSEGLNGMVYNRCIGTRYCANNCPFKTRRFNYFDYQASDPRTPAKPWAGLPDQQQGQDVPTLKKMVHNPDVTVRMRGVMEKCTYCVQRIVDARVTAKNEHAQGRRDSDLVRDGELQTACQATCPTQAIVFGDLNDPNSEVSKLRANSRNYEMLEGQNLRARTTYLGKVRNRQA